MGYLLNTGSLQISGIITTAEVNSLGTNPYIFNTPENFFPYAFCITPISGTTQPTFSALLHIETISANRLIFVGNDPANINFYNFFGYPTRPPANPSHIGCLNIELITNNFRLTPADFLDPIAGDYTYKYNMIGTLLQ